MKESKLSLESIRIYFQLYNEGNSTLKERKIILEEQKNIVLGQIGKLKKSIDYLNYKINRTEKMISESENVIK